MNLRDVEVGGHYMLRVHRVKVTAIKISVNDPPGTIVHRAYIEDLEGKLVGAYIDPAWLTPIESESTVSKESAS